LKKYLILLFFALNIAVFSQAKFSSINSMPGAFSRMGFGARGIGMGNALSAVTDGNLVSYYNPALAVFQNDNSFQTGFTFLSLDRHLNFLNFTKRFDFDIKKNASDYDKKNQRSAGISIGVIQSGVSNIDGRDNDDFKTGDLSTNEYQFFLGLANRFSEKFAAGIAVKIYYNKLYKDVTSSTVGLDIGAIYRYNNNLNFSFSISDLNSKYRWDSSPVYSTDGSTTEEPFPVMKTLGVSYNFRDLKLLTSAELEISNADSKVVRLGAEYNLYENLYVRGGLDQWDLGNSDRPAEPACGFSYVRSVSGVMVGFDYAFQIENYSASSRHVIGLSVNFK
jgi:hypothetical protein